MGKRDRTLSDGGDSIPLSADEAYGGYYETAWGKSAGGRCDSRRLPLSGFIRGGQERGACRGDAYKAVMKPTEGTILTVIRKASEAAQKAAETQDDPFEVGLAALTAAKEALAKTPELLPVLKKAGVVDAGGQGLVLIFEGIESVWRNGVIVQPLDGSGVNPVSMPSKATVAAASDDIEFGYCSEFLIEKSSDAKEKDPLKLRAYLESIGDCVVVVDGTSAVSEPGCRYTKTWQLCAPGCGDAGTDR